MKSISEQQFYDLLSLKLSGDATAHQLACLQEQLLGNPHWQFINDQMMQSPGSACKPEEYTRQAYAAHFVKMQLLGKFESGTHSPAIETNLFSPQAYPVSLLRRVAYPLLLAGLFAGVILSIRYYFIKDNVTTIPVTLNEVATRKGSKSNVKLPDGTIVWLNADSKLTYREQFIGKTREVSLIGEAYFDVAHDTVHPFIIHTGNANITVIGTAFNVRNYPEDDTWETTLMRGKIEVSLNENPGEKIILKPLQKLIIAKDNYSSKKKGSPGLSPEGTTNQLILTTVNFLHKDSLVAETSWINDKLVFINEPLEKIAFELERQFAITVIFKTAGVKDYRYTADFDKQSLEKILQIIRMSKKINYSITDSSVIIE